MHPTLFNDLQRLILWVYLMGTMLQFQTADFQQHAQSYIGEGHLQLTSSRDDITDVTYFWMLHANPHSGNVTLVVTQFEVSEFDELIIYDGTGKTYKLSYMVKPRTMYILSNKVNVTFFGRMGDPMWFKIYFKTTVRQSELFLRGSGRIQSPNFPNYPPSNMYIRWILRAWPEYGSIIIDFRNFSSQGYGNDFGNSLFIFDDQQRVFDANLQYTWKSWEKNSKRAHFGSAAEVIFISKDHVVREKFDLEFLSIPFQSGATFVGSARISSTDFPHKHDTNITTIWILQAEPEKGNITLFVREFVVNDFDVFRIHDSTGRIVELSRSHKIPESLILSSEVNVTMLSHPEARKYYEILFMTTVQHTESILQRYGTVLSPGFPIRRPNNMYCKWTLQALPESTLILINFRNFSISSGDLLLIIDDRGRQMELVGDTKRIAKYGSFSFSSVTTITYVSGDALSARGFQFDFSSLPDSCGGLIRERGTILSPNYPKSYPGNSTCTWHLEALPSTGNITLVIPVFHLNESDKLLITDSSGRLHIYSRRSIPPSTVVLGNKATVELIGQYGGAAVLEIFFFTTDDSLKNGGEIEPDTPVFFYAMLHSSIYNESFFYQWTFRARPEDENTIFLIEACAIKSMDMLFVTDSTMQRHMFKRSVGSLWQTAVYFAKEANITFIDFSNSAFFTMILFSPNASYEYSLYGSGRILFPKDVNELQSKIYCHWKLIAWPTDRNISIQFLHFNVWWHYHILIIEDERGNTYKFTWAEPPATNMTLFLGHTVNVTFTSFMRHRGAFRRAFELHFSSSGNASIRHETSSNRTNTASTYDTSLQSEAATVRTNRWNTHEFAKSNTPIGTSQDDVWSDVSLLTSRDYTSQRVETSAMLTSTLSTPGLFSSRQRTGLTEAYAGTDSSLNSTYVFSSTTTDSDKKMTTRVTTPNGDKKSCSNYKSGAYNSTKSYPLGTIINGSCSREARLISWRCTAISNGNVAWTMDQQYNCTYNEYLEQIAQVNVTKENLLSILSEVASFTADAERHFGEAVSEVDAASRILTKVVSLVMKHSFHENVIQILNQTSIIASHLINAPSTSLLLSSSFKNVPHSMERLLTAATTWLNVGETRRFVTDNAIYQVTSKKGVIGFEYHSKANNSREVIKLITSEGYERDGQADALIYFHDNAKDIRKSLALYKNNKLFRGHKMCPANDVIISAQLAVPFNHEDLVTTHFKVSSDMDSRMFACGFWNYTENEWSTFGCNKKKSVPGLVVCSCNNTANFAALTFIHRGTPTENMKRRSLTVVSRTGLSLSIATLLIVIVTHLAFRRLKKSMIQMVLFNVALTIMLLSVTFLVGIDNTQNRTTCIAHAALLHLFMLSSCTWLSAETMMEYIRIRLHSADASCKSCVYAAIPAWGVPIIVVAVPLTVDHNYYDTMEQGLCWINGDVLHYGLFLPFGLTIVFNCIMFVLFATALCICTDAITIVGRTARMQMVVSIRRCLSIFVLTGLTWIFGFLAIGEKMPIFHNLFCIFSVAQGLTIFISHGMAVKVLLKMCHWRTNNGKNVTRLSGGAAATNQSNSTRVTFSQTEIATSQF